MNKQIFITLLALAGCLVVSAAPVEETGPIHGTAVAVDSLPLGNSTDYTETIEEEWYTPIPTEAEIEEESQAAIKPDDSEETSKLSDETRAYNDFCLSSRDFVVSSIKRNVQGLAAEAFALFFKTSNDLLADALNVQQGASATLGKQLRNPDSPIVEGQGEIGEIVKSAQEQVAQGGQPAGFYRAFIGTLEATRTSLARGIKAQIDAIGQNMRVDVVTDATRQMCDEVAKYEDIIRGQFEAARKEIVASNPELGQFHFEQVNCLTSKRVVKLNGFCQLVRVASSPIIKMLGKPGWKQAVGVEKLPSGDSETVEEEWNESQ